ncbi:zinc finger CCCH domain-containing protein 65 isoform X1 [Phoenix dactylifera]|uniref:Zinc finger CCCH domain-containing protein 65 isoform X1 n=1 Tax=Phoenix dactylifera TaxID=42345 RepID=A0A8B7CC06_PHODC|nr:zinc finger CCCH domain-containing protein 65 isoform X1 [Phoenix dactylifera]
MVVSEAEVVPKAEELGLGLAPAPSSSSCPPDSSVEALTGELASLKLEKKSAEGDGDQDSTGAGDQEEITGAGDQEEITGDENDGVLEKDSGSPGKEKDWKRERFRYPQRPDEPDCMYYLKTGSCRFGSSCKFNHPARRKRNQVKSKKPFEANQAVKEEQKEPIPKVGQTESKAVDEMQNGTLSERVEPKESKFVEKREGSPSKMVDQTERKATEEKGKETLSERGGQTECKYYSMPGGCKFGKACKYVHHRGKHENNSVQLNFLGLPIRPGERECPYYMRNGSCKFATNCKYHHPDPTAVGGQDPRSGHRNSEPPQQRGLGAPQVPMTWPVQTMSNEPVSFLNASPSYVPGMILPPQRLHSNLEWNGYQAPVSPLFPPDIHARNSSASTINHKTNKGDIPVSQQVPVDEYPERPGLPECQYFMKHGVCKFKTACKFHHPKTRLQTVPVDVLSPVGLPLKPDQPVCTHYSRFGVCKYGPSCRFDHPIGHSFSASAGAAVSGQTATPNNATTQESYVTGSNYLVQQPE